MSDISSEYNNKFNSWVLAARPKTLLAAVVPVLIGTSLAISDDKFYPAAASIALLCSILIQVGTNFVNDLYDFLSGTDSKERLGPTRALAAGLISVNEMKLGIYLTFGLAFAAGLYLVYIGGWIILLIGIISILSGIAYTAGPFPLAYNGLGDLFVFLFFGFVATIGTYYVQASQITSFVIWSAFPVGALITNILVVNNYRDLEEDAKGNKNTLAVKFGKSFTRIQYIALLSISYSILFVGYFFYEKSIFIFLPLLTLPIAVILVSMLIKYEGKELNKTLELTAKFSALFGILFAFGILL